VEREELKVIVKFLGPISRDDLEINIKDENELREILKKELSNDWLESVAVAINDEIVSDLKNIKDGDVITLLPPVCGG